MKWTLSVCTIIPYCLSICDAVITIFDTIGSTITLECSHSESQKITWKGPYLGNATYSTPFGINTNLPEDLHSRLFAVDDQTKRKTTLRIVNVQITDEGSYQCFDGESRSIELFDLQLPGLLSSNDPTYNRFLLVDPVLNKLIVGQMNAISLIDLQDKQVFPVQSTTTNFHPESSKLSYCILQKPEVPYCQNHIRFITKKTEDTFILCGTNANSPTGYEFNITDNSVVNKGDVPCSNDPFDNFTAIYTTTNNPHNRELMYYGATKNGESTISRPIYDNDGNVQDYMKGVISNKWMKDPQFVGSFDIDDRVLFFFREVAIEEEPFERKIYSRVAKVCKEDIGGDSMLRNKWTGYQKAKLDCSIPGDFPIAFDVLQDVVSVNNKIFYGLFTSGVGTAASAICAFNISEIEQAFDGQFKEPQVNSLYHWTAVETTAVPTPRPGVCTNDSLSISNDVLTFIVDHPLMHEVVQPLYDKPVFVLDDVELQKLELHGNISDVIFYAASNTGTVYKLLLKDSTTYVSSTVSPFNNSEVIWSMKQHGDYLYLGTDNTVRNIKVINCEQYRWIDSCVKDPHCAWINDANLLSDSSVEDEVKCYNRCRPLSFVEENGLTNNPGVYSHNNYDLSQTTTYSCCPSKPTELQVITVQQTQIELRWIAGFNGGHDQVFVIEYKKDSSMSWLSNEFNYEGVDNDPHIYDLQGLALESAYSIRLYAKNNIGQSAKTSPIVISTKAGKTKSGAAVIAEGFSDRYIDEQYWFRIAIILAVVLITIIVFLIGTIVYCKMKNHYLQDQLEERINMGKLSNVDGTKYSANQPSKDPNTKSPTGPTQSIQTENETHQDGTNQSGGTTGEGMTKKRKKKKEKKRKPKIDVINTDFKDNETKSTVVSLPPVRHVSNGFNHALHASS